MANTLTVPKAQARITATLSGGAAPAMNTTAVNHTASSSPAVGSGAGSVQLVHSAAYLVTAGTPLVIDLTATVDPLGASIVFAFVNEILVSNGSVSAGQDFTVGGGTTPVITAAPLVKANGGAYYLADPNPGITVDSTHKLLTISVAAGTSVPVQVTVLGR